MGGGVRALQCLLDLQPLNEEGEISVISQRGALTPGGSPWSPSIIEEDKEKGPRPKEEL